MWMVRIPRGRGSLAGMFRSIVKYTEYPACVDILNFSTGNSSDAAFHCSILQQVVRATVRGEINTISTVA